MANRFLTLDEVAANAMTIVPTKSTEDRNIFKQWAWIALRDLGPSYDNIDVCTLYPSSHDLRKPQDFAMAMDIALFDSNDNELKYKFRRGKYRIHQQSIQTDTCGTVIELSESPFFFHMSTDTISDRVAYAVLRYFKLPVDKDGVPMVPETALLAIMSFIRYMWELKEGSDRLMIATTQATWNQERERAKGRFRNTNMLMGKQIAKEWMSLIGTPNFDRF
jgi:hypothetical protein